jgi:hypothetical protein
MSDPTDIETEARGGKSGDFLPFGCVKITFKKIMSGRYSGKRLEESMLCNFNV